jgi:hypothetical protein
MRAPRHFELLLARSLCVRTSEAAARYEGYMVKLENVCV